MSVEPKLAGENVGATVTATRNGRRGTGMRNRSTAPARIRPTRLAVVLPMPCTPLTSFSGPTATRTRADEGPETPARDTVTTRELGRLRRTSYRSHVATGPIQPSG